MRGVVQLDAWEGLSFFQPYLASRPWICTSTGIFKSLLCPIHFDPAQKTCTELSAAKTVIGKILCVLTQKAQLSLQIQLFKAPFSQQSWKCFGFALKWKEKHTLHLQKLPLGAMAPRSVAAARLCPWHPLEGRRPWFPFRYYHH